MTTTLDAIPDDTHGARVLRIFVCYRRVDGSAAATSLVSALQGQSVRTMQGEVPIEVFFDVQTPVVDDWQAYHGVHLERADALVLVASPGAAVVEQPVDWIQHELHWWIDHDRPAPIVIDITGSGDRYIPRVVKDRWPGLQWLYLPWERMATMPPADARSIVSQLVRNIQRTIALSWDQDALDELDRQKRHIRELAAAKATADALAVKLSRTNAVLRTGAVAMAVALLASSGMLYSATMSEAKAIGLRDKYQEEKVRLEGELLSVRAGVERELSGLHADVQALLSSTQAGSAAGAGRGLPVANSLGAPPFGADQRLPLGKAEKSGAWTSPECPAPSPCDVTKDARYQACQQSLADIQAGASESAAETSRRHAEEISKLQKAHASATESAASAHTKALAALKEEVTAAKSDLTKSATLARSREQQLTQRDAALQSTKKLLTDCQTRSPVSSSDTAAELCELVRASLQSPRSTCEDPTAVVAEARKGATTRRLTPTVSPTTVGR